jgi:hypothetical protein
MKSVLSVITCVVCLFSVGQSQVNPSPSLQPPHWSGSRDSPPLALPGPMKLGDWTAQKLMLWSLL